MSNENNKGHLILVMAPSGSGKRVLVQEVRDKFPQISYLVSCTTRTPRPREVDSVDYHFLSESEFDKKIADGEFMEWVSFGGNKYGTLRSSLLDPMSQGKIVLNEVDVRGVESCLDLIPRTQATVIYIDAGGWETLRARAISRAPIDEAELQQRYQRYLVEREAKNIADAVIDNRDGHLQEAKNEIVKIVQSITERLESEGKG